MNSKVVAAVSASVGLAIGFAAGYFIMKARVEEKERKHYDKFFQEELRRTKAIYKIDVEKPGNSDDIPEKSERIEPSHINYAQLAAEYGDYQEPGGEVKDDSPYPKTYEEREERLGEAKTNRRAPQKEDLTLAWSVEITEDEFVENIPDYDQEFWTFYKGDAVMAGSDDSVIHNWQDHVDTALIEARSYDPETDVIHIRNEQRETDYEITFEEGKYSLIVESEGFDGEERKPKVLKFRREDE